MKAERARKQAVAKGNLRDVVGRDADGRAESGDTVAPHVEVGLRKADDRRFTRRSRRGVNPDDLALRHAEHPERIGLPQILLRRQRQQGDIRQRADVLGADAALVEQLFIVRHVVVGVLHLLFQLGELQLAQFVAFHRFNLRLKHLHDRHQTVVPSEA